MAETYNGTSVLKNTVLVGEETCSDTLAMEVAETCNSTLELEVVETYIGKLGLAEVDSCIGI